MTASFVIVWSMALVLSVIALRRSKQTFRQALRMTADQGRVLLLRMPLAVLIGAFIVELVPQEVVSNSIGNESGVSGILIASVAGALLPGGPYLSFPIAVALYKAGVGTPQLMAMLTAWGVYAVHRALSLELPLMGARFIALRLASSAMIPPLVGIIALLALKLPGSP